jgi:hypothetical protein
VPPIKETLTFDPEAAALMSKFNSALLAGQQRP